MDFFTFTLIFGWMLALWLMGWLVLPLGRHVFGGLPDGGLAAGRILVIALATLGAFWGAALHAVPLAFAPLWMFGLPLACGLAGWGGADKRREAWAWVRENRRALLFSDAVFLSTWAFFQWVRLRHPELTDLEKHMDAAITGSLTRTVFLPADNPWLSGVPFSNYYYFGHLMGALLARSFHTPLHFAYNLIQPAFCALFVAPLWALCAALTRSLRRGLVAMSMVALLGHWEPLRQWGHPINSQYGTYAGINWWSTSRVIPSSINEYPIFTLGIGDLHAHFFALSLGALFFSLCYALFHTPEREAQEEGEPSDDRFRRAVIFVLASLMLGILAMTNTWDVPTYGALFMLCAVWTLPDSFRRFDGQARASWRDVLWIFGLLPLARIVAAPYLRTFQAPFSGIVREVWSPEGTSFWLIFGGFAVLWLLCLRARLAGQPWRGAFTFAVLGMAATCLLPVHDSSALGTIVLLLGGTIAVMFELWKAQTLEELEDVQPTAPEPGTQRKSSHAQRERVREREQKQATWQAGADERRAQTFGLLLAVVGLLALLAPMMFYIRGMFGDSDYRHQDTFFKFGLQGWLLLGMAAACGTVSLWSKSGVWRWPLALGWALLWMPPLLCSLSIIWTRTVFYAPHNPDGSFLLSLDGARDLPDSDRLALDWLRRNAPPDAIVLEATSPNAYNEFTRVSTLTGVSTPLGWPQHVVGWGAQPEEVERRLAMTKLIYAWPDTATAITYLQNLRVRYIFVGELEHRAYDPAALERMHHALPVVFQNGSTFIVKVPVLGNE